jgi:hypothetical protein
VGQFELASTGDPSSTRRSNAVTSAEGSIWLIQMKRVERMLASFLLSLVLTVGCPRLSLLLAPPDTGRGGPDFGNVFLLFMAAVVGYCLAAVLLRLVFSDIRARGALSVLALNSIASTVALSELFASSDPLGGPFILSRLLGVFALLMPGLLSGVVVYTIIPRRAPADSDST